MSTSYDPFPPSSFIARVGDQNLAAEFYNDENVGPVLRQLADARIEDNRLILELHPPAEGISDETNPVIPEP